MESGKGLAETNVNQALAIRCLNYIKQLTLKSQLICAALAREMRAWETQALKPKIVESKEDKGMHHHYSFYFLRRTLESGQGENGKSGSCFQARQKAVVCVTGPLISRVKWELSEHKDRLGVNVWNPLPQKIICIICLLSTTFSSAL